VECKRHQTHHSLELTVSSRSDLLYRWFGSELDSFILQDGQPKCDIGYVCMGSNNIQGYVTIVIMT